MAAGNVFLITVGARVMIRPMSIYPSTDTGGEYHQLGATITRIPVSQEIVADIPLATRLQDPLAGNARVPVLEGPLKLPEVGPELSELAEMYICPHGGSLRRFAGALPHVNGWYPSFKRHRLQHWEGTAQLSMLQNSECDWSVLWAQSEARRFRFFIDGQMREYTCDLERRLADGTTEIIELKADERHLRDRTYRLILACVAEICRRIGFKFRIVFEDEIFENASHKFNVELFSSRAFRTVTPRHIRVLEDYAIKHGSQTTYGSLAQLLEPAFPVSGKAVIQALVVRRRIKIDLRHLITDQTIVKIL